MPRRRHNRSRHHQRARERYRFVVATAAAENVIDIHRVYRGVVVFAHAPMARTVRQGRACKSSFRRAIRHDLNVVALLAAKPRGNWSRLWDGDSSITTEKALELGREAAALRPARCIDSGEPRDFERFGWRLEVQATPPIHRLQVSKLRHQYGLSLDRASLLAPLVFGGGDGRD
jgi:hypothetical protein